MGDTVNISPPIQKGKGPWRVTFDTNPDDCNLRCVMCEEFSEYSNLKQLRMVGDSKKRRRMDISLIESTMEDLAKLGTIKEIIPSTMGEPLLFKNFERIIELCKIYDFKLNLTTNGTFPRKSAREWAELIVPVGSDVKISWNGATKETAEKIMLGANFNTQLQNIRDFLEVRDEIANYGGNYCSVTLQLTFLENNYREFPELVKLAANLGIDRIKGQHLWAHFNEIENQSMRRNSDSIKRWNNIVHLMKEAVEKFPLVSGKRIKLDNIYLLDEISGTEQINPTAVCPFLGKEVWVAHDGRFNPCCAPDAQRRQLGDFGNLHDQSVKQIWNGNKYQKLVNNYLEYDLCKSCNMRRPLEDVYS